MEHNEITGLIVDAAYRVHVALGPGLFESVYETCMEHELRKIGLFVERQKSIGIQYDDLVFNNAFRADLIVNNEVILELKSVDSLAPVHYKQLLTYLKLTNKRFGLLLNFGEAQMKDGIKRIVNGY